MGNVHSLQNLSHSTLTSDGLPTGQCTGTVQADMVFVLDSSGSVRYSNFRKMLAFVQDLINDFDIASDKVALVWSAQQV